MVGYVVPQLQLLGILWSVVTLADVPVSVVTGMLVWRHSLLAGVWATLVGTLWWYLLSRLLEFLWMRARSGKQ
jgi:hypothetical protein